MPGIGRRGPCWARPWVPRRKRTGGLLAKIIGLLLYIGLGMLALRPGRATSLRALAWVAALLVFGWIVSVAISKSPLGVFSLVL